jgi:hypothetical protein
MRSLLFKKATSGPVSTNTPCFTVRILSNAFSYKKDPRDLFHAENPPQKPVKNLLNTFYVSVYSDAYRNHVKDIFKRHKKSWGQNWMYVSRS